MNQETPDQMAKRWIEEVNQEELLIFALQNWDKRKEFVGFKFVETRTLLKVRGPVFFRRDRTTFAKFIHVK